MKQKRTIAKPSVAKKHSPRNNIGAPNRSSVTNTTSNISPINPKFNPKIIPEKYLLNPQDFEPFNKDPITGGFGIINFVRNKTTDKQYAAKTSYRRTNPQERKFFLRELNILMKVQHPTIVHFEGFSLQDMQGQDNII